MDAVRERSIRSGGVRLVVRQEGDPARPTVLLVHGYPDNMTVWDGVAERLRGRFHVVRYDVRGAGASEAPDSRDGYHLDQLAADVMAVVDATSPHRPVHLVGHDWGSVQAWHAVTDPGNAARIASYTTISGPDLGHVAHWTRRLTTPVLRQVLHSWYIGFFRLPVLPELVFRSAALRTRLHARERDLRNGLELYRENIGRRWEARWTSVPVLQIVPTRDPYVTPAMAGSAERWCEHLTRKSLQVGHWVIRSHPEIVARWITDHILNVNKPA
jgi:pimeloyl-ACP methyl ester carboxylesterase